MGFFSKLFKPKPLSQAKFAQMVMDCIRQAGEKGKITYDPKQFRLFLPGEDGTRLFLHNAYQEYLSVPKELHAELFQRFARVWFVTDKKTPEEYEDARHDLLPVIRSRGYFDSASLLMQQEGRNDANWPQQTVGDDLVVSLVYDLPEAMRSIGQEDLDKWGVTFYEAMEAAKENLMQLQHSFIGPQEGEGVYLSVTHDNYDASRLLLLDTIRQMHVKGDFVAMVPNRDTLIVTGSEDEEGLKGMLALAKDALQQPRPISGLALRLDSDEWVPWMPNINHPLYGEFRMLQVQSIGQDYCEQKELLEKLHTKKGQDIFVASYMVMANEDTGQVITYCVWAKNVLTLLPRTDRIAFVQDGKDPVMADWDRVIEVAGDLMTPMDIYPERFQVSEFPTDGQLEVMGAKTP